MSNLKIKKLDESDLTILYHRYPGQTNPQDAWLELDCDEQTLTADTNGEIGYGFPERVWNSRVRRYHIPAGALPAEVNRLMEEIRPLAERVLAGYSCEWDGHNHVGRLNDDAADAEDEIEAMDLDDLSTVDVWDAGDLFADTGREAVIEEYKITPDTDPDDLVRDLRADAEDGYPGVLALENLEEYAAELIEMSGDDAWDLAVVLIDSEVNKGHTDLDDVERDGEVAVATWIKSARQAGDQDTLEAIADVGEAELATAWERELASRLRK